MAGGKKRRAASRDAENNSGTEDEVEEGRTNAILNESENEENFSENNNASKGKGKGKGKRKNSKTKRSKEKNLRKALGMLKIMYNH